MSLATYEFDPELLQLGQQIIGSYDGLTDENRFHENVVYPKVLLAAQLAIWDAENPNIIRSQE